MWSIQPTETKQTYDATVLRKRNKVYWFVQRQNVYMSHVKNFISSAIGDDHGKSFDGSPSRTRLAMNQQSVATKVEKRQN